MCSEWHIDLSTWLLTSERFWPSHVRVTLWCLFCIFWVDWNCSGLKAASFRFNCFHHTQVSWLSPPSSADITSIECLHTLGLTFFLCTRSPHVSCLFRMIHQLIKGSIDHLESNGNSQSPAAAKINPVALVNVPRDHGDAFVSSPQAAPLFLIIQWRRWSIHLERRWEAFQRDCSSLINYQCEVVESVSNMHKQSSNSNNE